MNAAIENNPEWSMAILFENEQHAVIYVESKYGDTYEIVDKAASEEVYLTGGSAQAFRAQCDRWKENVPHEEDVTMALEAYMALGRVPLCIH